MQKLKGNIIAKIKSSLLVCMGARVCAVINPVKYLYHFLSNYCMCACYKSCNFCIIFYPITVFIFITFQKFFKKELELSYHPIRHLQSHITIMHLVSLQTCAWPLSSLGFARLKRETFYLHITFYGGIVVCAHQKFCCLCSCSLSFFFFFFTAAHFHLAGR